MEKEAFTAVYFDRDGHTILRHPVTIELPEGPNTWEEKQGALIAAIEDGDLIVGDYHTPDDPVFRPNGSEEIRTLKP